MEIRDGFIGTIGNTPLIRLRRTSEETGCEILAKAEFLNPGSSVKDRAALYIVLDAERKSEFGFDSPAARVLLRARAGDTLVLALAPPGADGRIPLWVEASETLYLLDPNVAPLLAPAGSDLAGGASEEDPWRRFIADDGPAPGAPAFPR